MKSGFFGKFSWEVGLISAVLTATSHLEAQSPSGRGGGVIELPPIETALARKQLFVDFGNTSPDWQKLPVLPSGCMEVIKWLRARKVTTPLNLRLPVLLKCLFAYHRVIPVGQS